MDEEKDLLSIVKPGRPKMGITDRPVRVLGIDLGTTNSTVSEIKWDPSMPTVPPARVLEIEQRTLEGAYTHSLVPSVVAFHNGKVLVGEGAKRLRARSAELELDRNRDIFYECKNEIGIKKTYHRAPERYRSAAEIGSHVVEFMVEAALADDPTPIDRVVVTVPASFQVAQRHDTVLAMRLAGATERVRRNLGLALLPQAGLAVGLVILVQGDPALAEMSELFTAVVLTAVTINELVGPIATKFALDRSGEIGRDRPRLVDFLQEENITTGLRADTMEDAIRQLVELLVRSHHLKGVDREELLASVLAREAQVSTCLGEGLAVPHGDLPEGLGMVGVLGLAKDGLGLPTPDGKPVHCMLLLATPRGERDRHLEVLATMARTVGSDPLLQSRLYGAATPAHAYEILHGEETEDFNYFLEDESPLR
jgi:mannitol/fructose-specific phosphotransferase system IIA component (Ntr-type)